MKNGNATINKQKYKKPHCKKKKKKMFRYVKKDLVMTIKTPSSSRSLSLQEIPKRN